MIDQAQIADDGTPSELNLLGSYSYDKTMSSAEGKKLVEEWNECVRENGFSVDEAAPLSVELAEGASDEQRFAGYISEATCSDEQGTVQGLFDIEAQYQQEYIDAREALFVEIAVERDKVVERAAEILGRK